MSAKKQSKSSDGKPSLTAAKRAKATKLLKTLQSRYTLGKEANEKHKSDSKKWTSAKLADSFKVDISTLRKSRRFASGYTPAQFEKLCKLTRPDGLPLQSGHVTRLLTIKNKSKRRKWQKDAAENGWTAEVLARKLIEDRKRIHEGGRKMTPPKTAEEGLSQLMHEAELWIRRCEVVMEVVEAKKRKRGTKKQKDSARDSVITLKTLRRNVSTTIRLFEKISK